MKRRLSLAIALVGSPSVVVLDEPTESVDPVGRKRLWKVIEMLKGPDQSIIVSTHDIDECGKLCSSFGIMHSGDMREIGYTDSLKQKYLVACVRDDDREDIYMTLTAIAAKYRPSVDKIGRAITSDMNVYTYWISLRGRDEEELKKFQQKLLNEAILRAGDYAPGFRNEGLPRHTIMDAEKGFEQLYSYLTQEFENRNSNYNCCKCMDIEPKIGGIENDVGGNSLAPAEYSISRQREWFKSIFDKQRSRVSEPKDGESCISEANLRCMKSALAEIGIIPLLAFKICKLNFAYCPTISAANHSTWDLMVFKPKSSDGPQQHLGYERHAIEGPSSVQQNTTETFYLQKTDIGKELGLVWFVLDGLVDLVIACMELEHGGLVVSAGFAWMINYYRQEQLPAKAVLDLPTCPDACTVRIESLTAQYESFAKMRDCVVRVHVPVVPQGIVRSIEVDIVQMDADVGMALELDERRSIFLDRVFWISSFNFQFYYVQPLLMLLNNPQKWDCVAIIDIENSLNVSLTNGTETVIPIAQNSQVGTSKSYRAETRKSRKLKPPAEVLEFTRELFYECGSMPIKRMFSYKIESTDLSIVVCLKVQEEDSSFAFAFAESSAAENETFEALMNQSESNGLRHRKFGYAKNGEKAVQIRNIIALVSMTEPKCKRTKEKDPPLQPFYLFKHDGYNINSQLNIRIFTF